MNLALYITAGFYLLCHLASHFASGLTWGFDAVSYFPWGGPALGLIGLIVLLTWDSPVADTLMEKVSSLPSGAILPPFLLLCGGALLALQSQTHLLGDGRLLIRELSLGAESPTDRAPLFFYLIRQVYAVAGDAEATIRGISVASGIGFMLLTVGIARAQTTDERLRRTIPFLLMTQGYAVIFFGYVESYALMVTASALYVWTAILCLHRKRSLWQASLAISLGICSHLACISLLPSLLLLAAIRSDLQWMNRLGPLCIVPVAVTAILGALEYPLLNRIHVLLFQHALPVTGALPETAAYLTFSWAHAVDILNALALAAPAFVVGFPLFFSRSVRSIQDAWYLCLCLPPVLFAMTISPEIGAFRDWDILSFPALFLTVAIGYEVGKCSRPDLGRRIFLLILVSLVHLVPWLMLNQNAVSSELRFRSLLKNAYLSHRGETYGWDSLAGYLRDAGRPEEAYEAYSVAISVNPEHGRLFRAAAHAAGTLGRYDQAIQHFESAMALLTDRDTLVANYGRALIKVGRNEDAARQFRAVLETHPDRPDVWRLLGQANYRSGQYDRALEIIERVIESYPPGTRDDYVLIGSIHGIRRDAASAIQAFNRALERSPEDADALNRLALAHRANEDPALALQTLQRIVEKDRSATILKNFGSAHYALGQYNSSALYFERAVLRGERSGDLSYRLGSALLLNDRPAEAIPHLQLAIHQDASIAGAYRNLAIALLTLKRNQEAKDAYRMLLSQFPDYYDRDTIQQWIESN